MGWFAVAVIIGFGFYFIARNKLLLWVLAAILVLLVVLAWAVVGADCSWAWNDKGHWSFKPVACEQGINQILDRVGGGRVARVILGIALGSGAGFLLHQRTLDLESARIGNTYANPLGLADLSAALSVAAAVALLALCSPYVDDWLRRVTGLKTAVVEFQLHSQTTHEQLVADNLQNSSRDFALSVLRSDGDRGGYPRRIQEDVDYLQLLETQTEDERSNANAIIGHITAIKPLFVSLLSPMADCLQDLHDEDHYRLDRLREEIHDFSDFFAQAMLAHGTENSGAWDAILRFADHVVNLHARDEHCKKLNLAKEAWKQFPPVVQVPEVERAKEQVPYLHVAAALLSHFVQDEDDAINILESLNKNVRRDYNYFRLLSKLRWYRGDSTSDAVAPLREEHKIIDQHLQRIHDFCRLGPSCSIDIRGKLADLDYRERRAELGVLNNFAYFVAVDIARGTKDARQYSATALDYAERLKKRLDAGDQAVEKNAPQFLDTYAYTVMVLEAQKESPNLDTVRSMRQILERVLEDVAIKPRKNSEERMTEKVVRAHLASAQQLVGE